MSFTKTQNKFSKGIDDRADDTTVTIDEAGNVGIGTNPTQPLHVSASMASAGSGPVIQVSETSGGARNGIHYTSTSTTNAAVDLLKIEDASGTLFNVQGGGNVGIGTDNPAYTLDIRAIPSSFNPVRFSGHSSSIDAFLYTDTAYWSIGDTVSYGGNLWGGNKGENFVHAHTNGTERMRIDSSGNVGIGGEATSFGAGVTTLQLTGNASGEPTRAGALRLRSQDKTSSVCDIYSENGFMSFYTGTSATTTERMRIDSSGNVGIGETNPNFKLDVTGSSASSITDVAAFTNPINAAGTGHGARLLLHSTQDPSRGVAIASSSASNYAADNDMLFYTSVSSTLTERMRIDAAGNLLVGKTATNSADSGVVVANISDAIGQVAVYKSYSGTTSAMKFYYGLTQVGRIDYSDTTTDYITSSDIRLKENIVDAPAGNIDSIKVRSFDWKADGSHQEYGFIAQELETVAPYAVSKGETDEDTWGVDYSKLVPMLVKEIQDLKAEVAALKGA